MLKFFFRKNIIILLYFVLITQAWAEWTPVSQMRYCLSKTKTPQYNFIFNLPVQNAQSALVYSQVLVVRFYQAFGNGDASGWQTPLAPPVVDFNGIPISVSLLFGYTSPSFLTGGLGLGYDQYAQYYGAWLNPILGDTHLTVTLSGFYQPVAYMSASIYQAYLDGTTNTVELIDANATTLDGACNPNIKNHPSIFAYPAAISPAKAFNQIESTTRMRPVIAKRLHKPSIDSRGQVALFRLDHEDSLNNYADDIAPDGCSRAYLFGAVPDSTFVILRIKLPKTFIEDAHPDKKFKYYPLRYISIGAHYYGEESTGLDFWTVNGRMLKQYEDKSGYAYVFFAPNDYVQNIVKKHRTPSTQPPVITWGKYTGYLLGEPNFAIILRYRVPDPHWKGSPENAVCYATQADLKPVTKKELGQWLPEAYSGTEQAFLNGQLGQLQKDQSWPEE